MQTSLRPTQWIEQCALVLHERWHTIALEQLEEVAMGIWNDERLRNQSPAEAAKSWLLPLSTQPVDSDACPINAGKD